MVDYDPYSPELYHNPYPVYRQLRQEAPVWYNAEHDFYALSRYDDVLTVLQDPVRFTSTRGDSLDGTEVGEPLMVLLDPPEHTAMRKTMSRLFTPRAIAELEDPIRAACAELLDPYLGTEGLEVVSSFATRLPLFVIGQLVGLPPEYEDTALKLSDVIARRDGTTSTAEAAFEAAGQLKEFLQTVTTEKRKHPGDDVISALVKTPIEEADGTKRSMDDNQISWLFMELTFAGHETTSKLISNGIVALSWYPDQRRELASDPSLVPNAVEEMLRWDTPSHYMARGVTEDVEFHGVTIPADAKVSVIMASGNHDEKYYEEPELFDMRRKIDRNLSFGFGHHVCIGAALTRLETRVAFEELLRRFPDFHVDDSGVVRAESPQIRGLQTLPIVFDYKG